MLSTPTMKLAAALALMLMGVAWGGDKEGGDKEGGAGEVEITEDTKKHIGELHKAGLAVAQHLGKLFRKDDGVDAVVEMEKSGLFGHVAKELKEKAQAIDKEAVTGLPEADAKKVHHKLHNLWAFVVAEKLLHKLTKKVHGAHEHAAKHFGHVIDEVGKMLGIHGGVDHLLAGNDNLKTIFESKIRALPIHVRWHAGPGDAPEKYKPDLELEPEEAEEHK